jgi:hypothetical protein
MGYLQLVTLYATTGEALVMKVHSLLIGRLKLLLFFLLIVGLLATREASAEPDRLLRAFLGVSSIPVRFPPPKDKNCCYLTIAKFKDGKFLDYAALLAPPIEYFHVDADHPNYEAELGWAEKDSKFGFFLTTPGGSQGFHPEESFRGLGVSQYLALGRAPSQTLGPFSVLGFALGGGGTPVEGAKPGDVRDIIRGKFQVVVFLMGLFETEGQAREFGNSLPKLSVE